MKDKIRRYYKLKREIAEIDERMEQIQYLMNNVKGVGFDNVRGTPKEAGERIIDGMMDKDALQGQRDTDELEMALLHGGLGLGRLSEEETRMLELVHYEEHTYDEVAEIMHYSNKSVIAKKLKRIYDKLEDNDGLPF